MSPKQPGSDCALWRRVAAIFYDAMLMFAVLFIATAVLLPFSGGEAIGSGNPLYCLYLLLIGCLYFTWQWVHGGQTLGMRAWRVRVAADGDRPPSWCRAAGRCLAAILSWALLGGGFIWALFDPHRRTLHDRLSRTRLVMVRREE